MVLACEMLYMPAPRIEIFPDSTKVTLFSHMEFANITMKDKLWSCYLHACLMYIQRDGLTNSSLRNRFGVKDSLTGSISRLIKPLDPDTAPWYMKYIPTWA